jgi:chemotaxis protein CheX
MTVADEELEQIAGDIWSTILGLDLRPAGTALAPAPPAGDGPRVFTGCILITGDWEGAVTLDLPSGLARRAGAIMFGSAPEDVADAEIRDVVGELTNMTGGNVKALVGGTCQLSLPAVTEGVDYLLSLPGSSVVNRVQLDCDGQTLLVTVLERTAPT